MGMLLALIPKPLLYGALGLVVGVLAVWGIYAYGKHEGRQAERQAILERSVDLLRERNHVDEQTRNMDSAELCRALGGVWLPGDSRCE